MVYIKTWVERVLDGSQPNGAFARDAEILELRAALAAQTAPPVVDAALLKSGLREILAAAKENWNYYIADIANYLLRELAEGVTANAAPVEAKPMTWPDRVSQPSPEQGDALSQDADPVIEDYIIPGDGFFGGLTMKIDHSLPPDTIEMQGANRVRMNVRTGEITTLPATGAIRALSAKPAEGGAV